MQFAKDKRSGAELAAKKAIPSRTYACPVCGEDVYVRGGIIRVRHFAHRSGRADPNCENYHGGSAIGNPLTLQGGGQRGFVGDDGVRIDPLALGFRVEPPAGVARGDRRRWRLVLTLPKSLTGFGRLRVPTGFGTQRREVRLFSLSQAPQDIDVSPNATRFGPEWTSDEVDHDYRDIVSDRLDGFAHDCAQAFTASGAKIKSLANNFVWGDSYYIIWKDIDLVIPEVLNAQPLAPHEGWSAAFIALPIAPSNEVVQWLDRSFRLRIQQAKRQWGIVFPPPIDVDIDGNISVFEATSVVLGFFEAVDNDGSGSTLSITTAATRHEVTTKIGTDLLLHVARDALDSRGPLRLQWDTKYLPSVMGAQLSDAGLSLPAVMLCIRDSNSDHDLELLYHRPEARHALDRVRFVQAKLIAIFVPRGLAGLLERRSDGGPWKSVLSLGGSIDGSQRGSSWTLSAAQLGAVADALLDIHSDVRLSFGIFGQYVAVAQSKRAGARARLSRDTRSRILWYCRANGLARSNPKCVVDFSTDDELLQTFSRASPLPHLIGHRNLLQQLVRIEGRKRIAR